MPELSDLQIRSVGAESLEDLAALWARAQAARNPLARSEMDPLQMLQERSKLADSWFAAGVLNGDIVAMAHGMWARENDGDGDPIPGLMHLSMIAVKPAFWGRGYGRKMTEFSIVRGLELGFETIQLWTQPSNERARRLYESLGFEATGRVKVYDGEPIGLYVLGLQNKIPVK